MMTAAPPGPYASYCASSYETPGSSPVPRRIARFIFSAGMFSDFASAMIVRSRGFMSGSPPPARAATVNSLMILVKILPRLASRAPFLCLMEAHLECRDIGSLLQTAWRVRVYHPPGQQKSPDACGHRGFVGGSSDGIRIPATSYSPTRLPWQYHRRWMESRTLPELLFRRSSRPRSPEARKRN